MLPSFFIPYHLLYYVTSFIFEDHVFGLLLSSPKLFLNSRLFSKEYIILYYPIIVFTMSSLTYFETALQSACIADSSCRRKLKATTSPITTFFTPTTQPTSKYNPNNIGIIDNGDPQWSSFRAALPLLTAFAVFFCLASRYLPRYTPVQKRHLNTIIGLGFLLYLHGVGSVFTIALTLVYHRVPPLVPRKLTAPLLLLLFFLTIVLKDPNLAKISFATFSPGVAYLDAGKYNGEYVQERSDRIHHQR